jgi:hypothetical protein
MKPEQLEASLLRVNEWIKAVDQKISIALVFEVGVITIISKPTYSALVTYSRHNDTTLMLALAASAIVFACSLIWAIFALRPHIKSPQPSSSLIFFGSVASLSLKKFNVAVKKATGSSYSQDLTEQIHINSGIALKKHMLLSQSLLIFLSGVILWLISLALIFR